MSDDGTHATTDQEATTRSTLVEPAEARSSGASVS